VYYEGGQLSYVGKDSAVEQLSYDELIVPAGAECHVVLEDSTRVWLNSKSKLIYPTRFGREKREVYAEGEVYFEVRSDRRPFLVRSALGTVRVLGTAFGLTAYPNEPMLTTLISGKVAFLGLQRDLLALEPGYQVVVPLSGKPFVRPVDVEEFVSWKSGKYVFKARRLEEIMTVLQRWYDVVIFYQSERLKEIRFTGNVVRYDTIDTFLQVLEGTGELKYRMNGKTVILYQ